MILSVSICHASPSHDGGSYSIDSSVVPIIVAIGTFITLKSDHTSSNIACAMLATVVFAAYILPYFEYIVHQY